MTERTSTVHLTLTIVTPGGVPADITAETLAATAAHFAQAAIREEGTRATVSATVSSAFIVRTEVSA